MKKNIFIAVFTFLGLTIFFSVVALNRNIPITLRSDALLVRFSTDALINEADLIVIGEVKTTLPSQWNGPDGNDPKNASPEEISRARGLFTDSLISINQILKGNIVQPVVRVRSFIGESEKVRWVNKNEPSYVIGKIYLLFLAKDTGATAKVDPGDYVSVGAYQGVYEIVDGRAISADDEWVLEDLIAYIEQSLSAETPLSPTELPAEVFTITPEPLDLPTETLLPIETASPTP